MGSEPIDASAIGSSDGQGSDALNDTADAANNATVAALIKQLKHSFMRQCSARGSQLSDGQRQRVLIACMLLRDATIKPLDKATSALVSEKIMQASDCNWQPQAVFCDALMRPYVVPLPSTPPPHPPPP